MHKVIAGLISLAANSAIGQGVAANGLPESEIAIGKNFELMVSSNAATRSYMLEFVDPTYFVRTSRLKKIPD